MLFAEEDLDAILQLAEGDPLQRIRMKIDLAASFFQDEAVLLLGKELADHTAMRRHGWQADLGLRTFFPILADFDTDGLKCRPNSFLESLVFLSGRQGVAPR